MRLKNIFGLAFVLLGIICILWSVYASWRIFTAKSPAPEIFKIQNTAPVGSLKDKQALNPNQLQDEIKNVVAEQVKTLIPSDFLPKLLNLVSWSLFASILIFAGSRISGIGIRLIRE